VWGSFNCTPTRFLAIWYSFVSHVLFGTVRCYNQHMYMLRFVSGLVLNGTIIYLDNGAIYI